MNRLLGAALAAAIVLALLAGALMMHAAWQHNPQGEFHELAADGTTIIHGCPQRFLRRLPDRRARSRRSRPPP
jgi:hypothetical protein